MLELNPCRLFKSHFDIPGAPQSEWLCQLAYGMTMAEAARLFYQARGTKQFYIDNTSEEITQLLE